ncbi:MAG: molybdopterin-dependent oxidoreductase, partial [Fimbriimonadaceae bacterium]
VGMCRMCLVEVGFKQPDGSVRKMGKPQAGCTLPASDGMVVYTDTEQVHKDRKGVLEFLLINHPLDCPICDQGGECPLQNNTMFYGPSTSRFVEMKRHLPKAFPLSKFVTLDLERCIQCGRCVRFTEEISGDAQLAFRFRGASMQPTTYQLTEFESKFSGNTIEICPVGALTSSKYRFRARPWDLETKPGIDTVTNSGANLWFDHRAGKFVRVRGRTNESVNEEWLSDRSMFGHGFYNAENRLLDLAIRREEGFVKGTWAAAYEEVNNAFSQGEVGMIVKPNFANEGLYMAQKMMRAGYKSNNIDHRSRRAMAKYDDRLENKFGISTLQTSIPEFGQSASALVFGFSAADDADMLYLRLRKAALNHGTKIVVATEKPTEVDSFAQLSLVYKPGTEAILAAGLLRQVAQPVPVSVEKFTPEFVAEKTGVNVQDLLDAGEILRNHKPNVAAMRSLLDLEHGDQAVKALAGVAASTEGGFNLLAVDVNEQGALDLGLLPDTMPGNRPIGGNETLNEVWGVELPTNPGMNTREMLQAAADGKLKALWLVNYDPLEDFEDRALAEKALENVDFLVFQGVLQTEAAHYASVLLPQAAPAEGDGSYTNFEGRVQRMKQIIRAPGAAKPAWRIFSEVLLRLNPGTPPFNPKDIMAEIAAIVPEWSDAVYANLDGEGVVTGRRNGEKPNLNALTEGFGSLA